MKYIEIDWHNLSLPVPQATLHYVAGVDPALRWEKRGLKSHDKDTDAEEELQSAIGDANRYIRTDDGQEKLQSFVNESLHIFNDMLQDPHWLSNHFPEKQFYFVAGPMRTGGTYLFTELCNLFDINWKQLSFRMVHDSIPTPEFLAYPQNPQSWLPLAFELAQFLNWVKKEFPGRHVIKKRITFGLSIRVIDNLFKDQADYLLSIRHPAGITQSGTELLEKFPEKATDPNERGWNKLVQDRTKITQEDWEALNRNERFLQYWEVFFKEVGNQLPLKGTLRPVVFGEDSESVIEEIAREHSIDYQPERFEPKDRDYESFWTSGRVEETFQRVRNTWKEKGREFPEIPLL